MNQPVNTKLIEKIPFFSGLSHHQVQQVLRTGELKTRRQGEFLFKEEDKSTEIYIVLAGELRVIGREVELARIRPVEIVGEMGVITGVPRCAAVEVVADVKLMEISKIRLDILFKKDVEMAANIYKNLLDVVTHRLRENNTQLIEDRTASGREIAASTV